MLGQEAYRVRFCQDLHCSTSLVLGKPQHNGTSPVDGPASTRLGGSPRHHPRFMNRGTTASRMGEAPAAPGSWCGAGLLGCTSGPLAPSRHRTWRRRGGSCYDLACCLELCSLHLLFSWTGCLLFCKCIRQISVCVEERTLFSLITVHDITFIPGPSKGCPMEAYR